MKHCVGCILEVEAVLLEEADDRGSIVERLQVKNLLYVGYRPGYAEAALEKENIAVVQKRLTVWLVKLSRNLTKIASSL